MIDDGSLLKVLVIGAGRRVQNNFLPALTCLADSYSIVGLHARTLERLAPVADLWRVRPVTSLSQIDLSEVDVAAISVPTAQNAVVLRQLLPRAESLRIVIDTPISWSLRELAATLPLLKKFKQVTVTEDYMNFPSFALIRKAVSEGLIGKLSGITLFNVGYYYHGLALIRSFRNFERARSTWRKSVGSFSSIVGYSFSNGYKAIVVGPYRRHTSGGVTLEGSKGVLSTFPGDDSFGNAGGRPVYSLLQHQTDGILRRLTINGEGKDLYEMNAPEIGKMADMPFADKSDLNLQRGAGLMTVFESLRAPNLNSSYGFMNAFYDSFTSRIASHGMLPVDPFVWVGGDVVKTMAAVAPLASRR